jgi:hypothetical protein
MLVLTGIFNLHVKVMRDAENAKFGLKVQGKTNSLKDIEVMVFLLTRVSLNYMVKLAYTIVKK